MNAANVETKRHNVAIEEIEGRANDINEQRNLYDAQYKRDALELDKQIKQAQLELDTAIGQRKLDLQEQVNWLQWKRDLVEQNYKQSMLNIADRETSVSERRENELERYQKALNDLGFAKNEIDAQLANIREKQAEYEKYKVEQDVRIQDFIAKSNLQKIKQDYEIGLIREENAQVANELRAELQEYQEAGIVTDSIWTGVGTILSGFKSVLGGIK